MDDSSNDDKDMREILMMREMQEQAIRVEFHDAVEYYRDHPEELHKRIEEDNLKFEKLLNEYCDYYKDKAAQLTSQRNALICLLYRNGILPEDIAKETEIPLNEILKILEL